MFYPCKISHCDVSEFCNCDLPEYNTHVLHICFYLGVCGWLPLYPPAKNSNVAAPELITNHTSTTEYVGGIEVSLSFSSDEDRELVLSHGQELGWVPANTDRVTLDGAVQREGVKGEGKRELKDEKCRWKFSIEVTEVSVPVEAVTILLSQDPAPYMYCYLKYRFFDSGMYKSTEALLQVVYMMYIIKVLALSFNPSTVLNESYIVQI